MTANLPQCPKCGATGAGPLEESYQCARCGQLFDGPARRLVRIEDDSISVVLNSSGETRVVNVTEVSQIPMDTLATTIRTLLEAMLVRHHRNLLQKIGATRHKGSA